MRPIVLLAILTVFAFAQSNTPRIPADEAAKHFLKGPPPSYPPQAAMGRISGNVLLEVRIDESGRTSVRRLIQGHPLLVPAAVTAVNGWEFRPFEVNGKIATVITIIMVTFGNPGNGTVNDRAEMAFQENFWDTEDLAEEALSEGNYARSEELATKEKDLLSPESNNMRHLQERWQRTTTMGRLRLSQRKYEEAEQYFENALALRQNNMGRQEFP